MKYFQNPSFFWDFTDWTIMRDGGVRLYSNHKILNQDITFLRNKKYKIIEFNASYWKNKTDFHSEISKKLKFPSYYGKNLDAFNDCLPQIDFHEYTGLVLIFYHINVFWKMDKKFCQSVVDTITCSSRLLSLENQRFMALFQSDDRSIFFEPSGALSVLWDDRK